ncbi:RNA-guided endonuclease InsQ/TnpB family protein [Paenibacillus sp. GCM10027626]|uniref:RNA-guided endonuclease InsQ/TnpB family protein n=1 Tax=Paenibacillus sp. GCM10027626 TaxID=3273411 RepID=UPI003626C84D
MLATVHRGFVYRAYPKDEVKKYFLQCFGADRKIYNLHVDYLYRYMERIGYQIGDKIDKKAIGIPTVSQLKKQCLSDENEMYLYEVDAFASNEAKQHFFKALSNFNEIASMKQYKKSALKRQGTTGKELTFRDLKGLPKFHSKKNHDFSYTTFNQNGNITLENGVLTLPTAQKAQIKHVSVELSMHRPLPEDSVIKHVTISMNAKGQFHVSLCVAYGIEIPDMVSPTRVLGLDYSQSAFFVDSEGKKANYPLYMRKMEKKLAQEQRKLSRMVKGSNRWSKQRGVIANLHVKVANQRKDWLHKKAHALAKHYDMVVLEDLDLRKLSRNPNFAKKQQDNDFGHFRLYLQYKLEEQGKILLKTPKTFASTQICSDCGKKNTALKGIENIDVRGWTCPNCGSCHDRDINAALNLKQYGEKKFQPAPVA